MIKPNLLRRQTLLAFAGSPLALMGTPRRVFAQAPPPAWLPTALLPYVPYITAAAAVVSIISAVISYGQNKQIIDELGEINTKLDEVLQNQQAILSAIRDLPRAMDEAVLAGWENSYGRDINAYTKDYAAALAAKNQKNEAIIRLWQSLAISVPETASRLGDCDYGVFPFFGQAVAISIAVLRIQTVPRESQRVYYDGFIKQIDRWLNPSNARSIPTVIEGLKVEIASRRSNLMSLPRKVYLSTQRQIQAGNGQICGRNNAYFVNISGDFEAGFSGTQTMESESWTCSYIGRHPRVATVEGSSSVGEGASASIARILGLRATDGVPNPAVAIPVFTPSGFAVVDSRNQERIAIFQLLAKVADLPNVIDQMRYLQSALRGIEAFA
jgi:hypothetical protein